MENEIVCQGVDCIEQIGVEFYEKENESLCLTCAFKRGYGVRNRKRKNYWHCDRHEKLVRYYCETHDKEACQACFIVQHNNCNMIDIDDAIANKRDELGKVAKSAAEKREGMCRKLEEFELASVEHLKRVEDEVNSFYDEHLGKAEERAKRELVEIERDADEEIRKIIEMKEERKRRSREHAERRRQSCEDQRRKVLQDAEDVRSKYLATVEKVTNKTKALVRSACEYKDEMIHLLQQRDRKVLSDAKRVTDLTTETVSAAQMQCDMIKKNADNFSSVKFRGPEMGPGSPMCGRLGDYHGNWECISTVKIPDHVKIPGIFGCVSENEIAFKDSLVGTVYTLNLGDGETKEILGPECGTPVCSCALLEEDVIVCGEKYERCVGDTHLRCVSRYWKRQGEWKLVSDNVVGIQGDTPTGNVYVDVDTSGKILAAEPSGSNIYVIDPTDGQCEKKIKLENLSSYGRVLSFSSGTLLVKGTQFYVIERSGAVRNVIQNEEWGKPRCVVDPITDLVYVTYRDTENECNLVDEVSSDGVIQSRRIIEYPAGR